MSLPRYPKYKASGVEWLGEVPEHWEVVSLGRLTLSRCDGPFGSGLKSEHYTDSGVRVIRLQNIRRSGFDGADAAFIDADYYDRELSGRDVIADDLLIAGLGDDSNTVGRACVVPGGVEPAMVKADCFRFRLNTRLVLPEFAAAALCAGASSDAGLLATGSTRSRIPLSVMATRKLPVPPLSEQSHVAAFLSSETSKLDTLVAEQERLIELLKEKRQAVISHAVTKGLNPTAPMKDSGIEWLGEVPAHWEVRPLKYAITRIEQGWSPQCESYPAQNDEWGVLKVGCGNGDTFDPSEQKALPVDLLPETRYEVRSGDILMSRGNTQELVGAASLVMVVRPRLLLCDLLYRFRARPALAEPEFLVLILRSCYGRFQLQRTATGTSASMKKIKQGDINELPFALPSVDEQRAIINSLRVETARFEALGVEAKRAIELLQERRMALISAAVTGQIDVRPSATRRPA